MTTESKSGKALGQEYIVRMRAYLDRTDNLPLLTDGSLNISAVAVAAEIPRQSLYKNPTIRKLLEDAKAKFTAAPKLDSNAAERATADAAAKRESKQSTALERRVHQLEQQNVVLVAENAELRRLVKALRLQLGREDMSIESGRRFPAPPRTDA